MILSALAGGLGDEASPSPTPSAPPHSGPLTHSASWECLSTLPTNGSPLRHVTHVRPRPPRRHRVAYFPPESVSSWVLVEMFSYRGVRCMRRNQGETVKPTLQLFQSDFSSFQLTDSVNF